MKKKKGIKTEEKTVEGNDKLVRNAIIVLGIFSVAIVVLLWKPSNAFLGIQYNASVSPVPTFSIPTEAPTDTPTPTILPTATPVPPAPQTSNKVMGCLNAPGPLINGEHTLFCGPPGQTPYLCNPLPNIGNLSPQPYICGIPGSSQRVMYCLFTPPVLMGCQ